MTLDPWEHLRSALDAAATPVRIWLRDDDAVTVTPALERLHDLCVRASVSPLLAVIPAGATQELGRWAAERPRVVPCQHGFAHRDHAQDGARACELGGARDDDAVLTELAAGRATMDAVFGPVGWRRVLVPPWNRIRPSLVGRLPAAGYAALSTFTGTALPDAAGLERLDCSLDIVDWRNGRRGRDAADLSRRLGRLVRDASETGARIGILTHHLAHDETAWAGLGEMLTILARHPAARLVLPLEPAG